MRNVLIMRELLQAAQLLVAPLSRSGVADAKLWGIEVSENSQIDPLLIDQNRIHFSENEQHLVSLVFPTDHDTRP